MALQAVGKPSWPRLWPITLQVSKAPSRVLGIENMVSLTVNLSCNLSTLYMHKIVMFYTFYFGYIIVSFIHGLIIYHWINKAYWIQEPLSGILNYRGVIRCSGVVITYTCSGSAYELSVHIYLCAGVILIWSFTIKGIHGSFQHVQMQPR